MEGLSDDQIALVIKHADIVEKQDYRTMEGGVDLEKIHYLSETMNAGKAYIYFMIVCAVTLIF